MGTERKFSEGDTIVAKNSKDNLTKGSRYVVRKVDSTGWNSDFHWVHLDVKNPTSDDGSYTESNFEHAPLFAVGDKVRLTADNEGFGEEGDTGTVVEADAGEKDCYIRFDREISGDHHWYAKWAKLALEPAATAVKFKVGDKVTTKGGFSFDPTAGTVGALPDGDGSLYKVDVGDGKGAHWNYFEEELTLAVPLATISSCAAAQVDNLRDEYGPYGVAVEPKFKVGDRVRCPKGTGNATVAEMNPDGKYRVVWADGEVGGIWWDDDDFEPISTPAIVCLIDNGQPLPSHRPHVHTTTEAATTEAERLATQSPGKVFGVYELTTRRVADVTVREVA